MKAGVSTSCLYPLETAKALVELGMQGVKNVELYLSTFSEYSDIYLRKLKSIRDHYGMTITSIHPFTSPFESLIFFSDYESRLADGIDMYKRYAHAANYLGAGIVVFHGSSARFPVEENRYFERYQILADSIKRCGVRLCQENVSTCQSGNLEFIKRMNYCVRDVSYVLDVKQCVRAGVDPYKMMDTMGKNIYHIHISDHDEQNPCMLIGSGNFSVEKFLLKVSKYNGDISAILELYRNNFEKVQNLGQNYKKLKEILL